MSVTAIAPKRRRHATKVPLERRTYTIVEVAQMLGISRVGAYLAARDNTLPVPVIRVGKRVFVSRAAFDRFLDSAQ